MLFKLLKFIFKLLNFVFLIFRKIFCFLITGHKYIFTGQSGQEGIDQKNIYECKICKKLKYKYIDTAGRKIKKVSEL